MIGPTESAIGRHRQADRSLHVGRGLDGDILGFAQPIQVDFAARVSLTRVRQRGWRDQATDMVGTIGELIRHAALFL